MGNHHSAPITLTRCSCTQQADNLENFAAQDSLTPCSKLILTPSEVIYYNIFPYMNFNDLLRLRRVCKRLKICSEDYIRKHHSSHGRVIDEKKYTLRDYINTAIPSKLIYLNNSSPKFFKDPLLLQFCNLYHEYITHLCIEFLSSTVLQNKQNLCVTLRHLKHLEVKTLVFCDNWFSNVGIDNWRGHALVCMGSDNVVNIKTLKVSEIRCPPGKYAELFSIFPNLEYLMLSRYTQTNQQVNQGLQQLALARILEAAIWKESYPTLKILDFNGCKIIGPSWENYIFVMYSFSMFGVKALNLNAELHKLVLHRHPDVEVPFKFPIVSMTNVHGELDIRAMPYLEKLEIVGPCTVYVLKQEEFQLSELSTVDIVIEEELLYHKRDTTLTSANIVDVLFNTDFGTKHKLKKLTLEFGESGKMPDGRRACNLWAFGFVDNCRNLTFLTLVNWKGSGKELFILWKGLEQLENLELCSCATVDDNSFLGFEYFQPAFLSLGKLVKLTLSDLDMMPGITNMAFEKVFRHTKMKEFYLTSNKPIKSISSDGIRSLLTGEFAKTVERFPFNGWSIEGMSVEEFKSLSMEFRSYRMV